MWTWSQLSSLLDLMSYFFFLLHITHPINTGHMSSYRLRKEADSFKEFTVG